MNAGANAGDDQNPELGNDAVLAERVLQAAVEGERDFLRSWEQLAALMPGLQPWDVAGRLRSQGPRRAGLPLSPWLYLSYYRIGRHLASGADPEALPVDGPELIRQIDQLPPPGTVLAFGDAAIAPQDQWQAVLELFQEGGDFIADLEAPPPAHYVPLAAGLTEARQLVRLGDPALAARMEQLLPVVILAQPGPAARLKASGFGGATTFFFRGGSLLNANPDHTLATLLETLVHEYAHAELFALGQEQHLCLNNDQDRHNVRIRRDPRPMVGILHGLHVSARVARLCERLLEQGLPWRSDRTPLLADLATQRDQARRNGLSCLAAVLDHGQLTPLGRSITAAAAQRLNQPLEAAALVGSLSPPA